MLSGIVKIGDRVTIKISKVERSHGINPCPDGTEGTVSGFGEVYYGRINNCGQKPGVYATKFVVKVQLFDRTEISIANCNITLTDRTENDSRNLQQPPNYLDSEFIRDLPETPFWEGDIVRKNTDATDVNNGEIIQIYYQNPRHYLVSNKSSSDKWMTEDSIELIERGRVWKFFHKEEITFENIKDEAIFFYKLGHCEEVRNPETNYYDWEEDQILDAIRNSIAHGFLISGSSPKIMALLFRDKKLGERVAKATLEGLRIDEPT